MSPAEVDQCFGGFGVWKHLKGDRLDDMVLHPSVGARLAFLTVDPERVLDAFDDRLPERRRPVRVVGDTRRPPKSVTVRKIASLTVATGNLQD